MSKTPVQPSLPAKAFKNGDAELMATCRALPYIPSETLYEDVEAYRYFIGSEIDSNAVFAKQILQRLLGGGFPMPTHVVETAAGTGASVRDMYRVAPETTFSCIELSEKLCSAGRQDNPHLKFLAEDMIAFNLPAESVDLVFNSASSLGFLNIEQLSEHFKNVGAAMKPHGRYFADTGFYSSPQAGYLSWIYNYHSKKKDGKKVTDLVVEPSMTLRYYPTTDIHDICYSTWEKQAKPTSDAHVNDYKFQKGYVHSLRAYRFSEMRFLARLHGLDARLWYYTEDRTGIEDEAIIGEFKYSLCDDSFSLDDSDECAALVVEIFKPGSDFIDLSADYVWKEQP
jgi:hypothetical protein